MTPSESSAQRKHTPRQPRPAQTSTSPTSAAMPKRPRENSPEIPSSLVSPLAGQPVSKRPKTSGSELQPEQQLLSAMEIDEEVQLYDCDGFLLSRPRIAGYHVGYLKAFDALSTICQDFVVALGAHVEQAGEKNDLKSISPTVVELHDTGTTLPVLKIILLGKTETGKSSCISGFQDKPGIAYSTNSHGRGTSIIHVYGAAGDDQEHEILTTVSYSNATEVSAFVESRCMHIYRYLERRSKCGDQAPGDIKELLSCGLSLKSEDQDRYRAACQCFHSILCKDESFRTEERTKHWFDHHAAGNTEHVTAVLLKKVRDAVATQQIVDNEILHCTNDEHEMHRFLESISRPCRLEEHSACSPHLWPLVKEITVHHHSNLLSAGITLVDTPGFADFDPAVVQRTVSYLDQEVDTVFVFSDTMRSENDAELEDFLRSCVGLGMTEKLIFVATKSDDVGMSQDKTLMALGKQDMSRQYAELMAKGSRLNKAGDHHGASTAWQASAELGESISEIYDRARRDAVLQRNCDAQKGLERKLKDLDVPDAPNLSVICTSANQCALHLSGETHDRFLQREDTGIPSLQMRALELAGTKRYASFSELLQKLRCEFHCVEGALTDNDGQPGAGDRCKQIFLLERKELLSNITASLENNFQKLVVRKLDVPRLKAEAHSLDLYWTWTIPDMTAKTLTACFNHDGGHKIRGTYKAMAWNADVQNINCEKVKKGCEDNLSQVTELEKQRNANRKTFFDRLKAEKFLENAQDDARFAKVCRDAQQAMATSDKDAFKTFRIALKAIIAKCTVDSRSSYVFQYMKKHIYEPGAAINQQHQSGVRKERLEVAQQKRQGLIKQNLPNVFKHVSDSATGEHTVAIEELATALSGSYARAEATVMGQLERNAKASGDDESKDAKSREELLNISHRCCDRIEELERMCKNAEDAAGAARSTEAEDR